MPSEASVYSDLQQSYNNYRIEVEKEVNLYSISLEFLKKELIKKRENPFQLITLKEIQDNSNSINSAYEKINAIIELHNKRSEEFEKEKKLSIDNIIEHYAADCELNGKYSEQLLLISKKKIEIDNLKNYLTNLEKEINSLEIKLSETVKGAEKINSYLSIFFGKDDLQIIVTPEKKFKLIRDGSNANNLSEGEKTAISFAYFTAKLEERNAKIEETIIYIDDPISSLDSNHLFNTYAFIKNKYCNAKQLFISTHNFEFFNLLKDWITDNKSIKHKNRELYLIQRKNNESIKDSELTIIHPLLQDFKSEYHYIFSIIRNFNLEPNIDYYHLYNLPNIIRRYLEAFLGFKVPKHQGLEKKLDYLIDNNIIKERVLKFIHHYSHNSTLSRSLNFPDLAECVEITKIVLNAIEEKDKLHFDVLVEATTIEL